MDLIDRATARQRGLKRYFTGKPCCRGHVCQRQTLNATCIECTLHAAARRYQANSEKIKDRVRTYTRANKEKVSQRRKRRYDALSEKAKIERSETRRQKWEANPELKKQAYEKAKEYRRVNADRVRASKVNREALKRNAEGSITEVEINFLREYQNHQCFYCEKSLSEYHVDHFVPVSKGGSNMIENLVIACPACNLRKQARHPLVFLAVMWGWL